MKDIHISRNYNEINLIVKAGEFFIDADVSISASYTDSDYDINEIDIKSILLITNNGKEIPLKRSQTARIETLYSEEIHSIIRGQTERYMSYPI